MFEDRIAAMKRRIQKPFPSFRATKREVHTVDEIQDILGVSKTSAYNLVKSGVFHFVKVGG